MASKYLWRGFLIGVLSVTLIKPTDAEGYPSGGAIAAAIVATGAAIVVVAVIVIHKSTAKRTITGCVSPAGNKMSVTDEKDKRLYTLSGDTTGIKPGERVTLQGRKITQNDAGKTLVWETRNTAKDLGVCQPSA